MAPPPPPPLPPSRDSGRNDAVSQHAPPGPVQNVSYHRGVQGRSLAMLGHKPTVPALDLQGACPWFSIPVAAWFSRPPDAAVLAGARPLC